MLKRHFTRDTVQAQTGAPRVVRVVLCDNHGYLTFAGECGCSAQHDYQRFAVVGTAYGWLHNTAGDTRFWASESGARNALKNHLGEKPAEQYAVEVEDAQGVQRRELPNLKDALQIYSACVEGAESDPRKGYTRRVSLVGLASGDTYYNWEYTPETAPVI